MTPPSGVIWVSTGPSMAPQWNTTGLGLLYDAPLTVTVAPGVADDGVALSVATGTHAHALAARTRAVAAAANPAIAHLLMAVPFWFCITTGPSLRIPSEPWPWIWTWQAPATCP